LLLGCNNSSFSAVNPGICILGYGQVYENEALVTSAHLIGAFDCMLRLVITTTIAAAAVVVVLCSAKHSFAISYENNGFYHPIEYMGLKSETDRSIEIFTGGLIFDSSTFMHAITNNLSPLIPPYYKKYITVGLHIDVNDEIFDGIFTLSGVTVLIPLGIELELFFGCQFPAADFNPHDQFIVSPYDQFIAAIKNKQLNSTLLQQICVPMVYIDHISLPIELRSHGFTSQLLKNIIQLLERIRTYKLDNYGIIRQSPRILLTATTENRKVGKMVETIYTGAAFWASRDFTFVSDGSRVDLIRQFIRWAAAQQEGLIECIYRGLLSEGLWSIKTWLSSKWRLVERHLTEKIKVPKDLLQLDWHRHCGSTGKDIGRRFLITAPLVTWQGQLVVL
jgi:hypothetical protein